MTQASLEAELWALAGSVPDPELPMITLAELGVLRRLRVSGAGRVEVELTPTYTGCPAISAMAEDIQRTLHDHGIPEVAVRTVLSPPWTTDAITEEGRRKLAEAGIAPPRPRSRGTFAGAGASPAGSPAVDGPPPVDGPPLAGGRSVGGRTAVDDGSTAGVGLASGGGWQAAGDRAAGGPAAGRHGIGSLGAGGHGVADGATGGGLGARGDPGGRPRGGGAVDVDLRVRCPRCGSTETTVLSRFSSTACKALRRCETCREPFDHFKEV